VTRARVAMTAEEVAAFLGEQRTLTCATIGRDGWPHLMPLWYVIRGSELWSWTYAKSQKVRNLERDARCTLQVETGETYDQLRGVMLKAECVVHRDFETVVAVGVEIARRYGGAEPTEDARAELQRQAAKRVGLEFRRVDAATWDHRKLY
jgi:nitroimidazol reductase NimA-like FMN-containing flavoprotein (pyridoxamine 5'-phosphate oxidase superfamily)